MKGKKLNRRKFMGGALAAGSLAVTGCASTKFNEIVPRSVLGGPRYVSPSQKLNIAVIGCGGKGTSDMQSVSSENIVALCDVDDARAAEAYKLQPDAKRYKDYREMLNDDSLELDAVVVSTPDHHHAPASLMAMRKGLHVYCQKPLTHTVHEARLMAEAARRYGCITQMGNQGTAEDGLRRAVELIQDHNIIGDVTEVHVWTNRPVWPQGQEIEGRLPKQDIPPTLAWDLWLGPAETRDYNKAYCPFTWRGFLDFGTGALGDMACHTANMAFMALDLGYPLSVEAEVSDVFTESFPRWSIITFEFPARGKMPPLTFKWYDGGKIPSQDYAPGMKFPNSGSLLVGKNGTLFSPNDYGAKFVLLPEAKFADAKAMVEAKPERLPQSPGHYKEWIQACKGEGKAMSNFDYAALLTETILLGNVALQAREKIQWNGTRMKVTNSASANKFISKEYLHGYTV